MKILNLPFILDSWLWHRGMGHPLIMPIVRNEMLLAGAALVLGLLCMIATSFVFWFGVGSAIMAFTFFTLAHFFLHIRLGNYSSTLFFCVLIRWTLRLLGTAVLLYFALVVCAAPVSALLAGLVCSSVFALVTYAFYAHRT
ncbi:MAG: hypothetical protein IJS54_00295 [Desulfovibrio sp.]|nr:hypothetical protein [Desulfovibrio sp.]